MSRKRGQSLNLFLDLQRAATALYLNPKGKTHLIFLDHAKNILKNKGPKRWLLTKLDQLGERSLTAKTPGEIKKLADEILTLGIRCKR